MNFDGEISRSTTSSYVSAVNTVFSNHDRSYLRISDSEFSLERGTKYSNVNLKNSSEAQQAFRQYCEDRYQDTKDIRYTALSHSVTIQAEAGLQFRESTQVKIASKELSGNTLSLVKGDGVKNNQPRTFSPTSMNGLKAAKEFVHTQNDTFRKGSLIPHNMTYREYKAWAYRVVSDFREASPLHTSYHFHGNRHYFAHREYEKAWSSHTWKVVEAPVVSKNHGRNHLRHIAFQTRMNLKSALNLDRRINLEVAEKLGHHRVDSGYAYNGK